MVKLTAKQQSFVALMSKSEEHARHGFELLLKRTDFEEFFDALEGAGLFASERNPAPVAGERQGAFRLPYWSALDYLVAVGKMADEKNDLALAQKVMDVVRAVSHAREPNGSARDNYYTWWKFAEIIGSVPSAAVTSDDLEMIPVWFSSTFDRGMVGQALNEGVLRKFLASDSPDDFHKACIILRHCTAIEWVEERGMGEDRKKPVTVMDDYWLDELIEQHASQLGAKVGRNAADIFLERIREIYRKGEGAQFSWLWRPAIEDHPQNHSWYGPENRFVEGLRDVLLSWISNDLPAAQPFVLTLVSDRDEIVRRIGIYVLSQRWSALRTIYSLVLGPQLLDSGHLHELYGLLRAHFHEMNDDEKKATIQAIRLMKFACRLPPPHIP